MNYNMVRFVKSAATPAGFIADGKPSVAFAGRSNVGKSSVINRLLNRKNFARVGSAPGKTVHVNYFLVEEKLYLTDLPGYGYAKVSWDEKRRWAELMEAFFAEPRNVGLGVLIVDIRHKPTEGDGQMAEWFKYTGRPFVVLANKLDKVGAQAARESVALIRETLQLPPEVPVLPFSAEKGTGRDELLQVIEDYCGEEAGV